MITIHIPTPLRRFTGGNSTIEVDASTVGGALNSLSEEFPEVAKNILDETGKPRSFVNIYVGEEDIRYLQGLETSVEDGVTILIVPSIAGGVD